MGGVGIDRPKRADVPSTLCLIRHGDAGDPSLNRLRDAERALSDKGRRQARSAGKALKRLGLLPSAVWASPLRRAEETAKIAARVAKTAERETTVALSPDADPAAIVRLLAATPASRATRALPHEEEPVVRWLVGHEPHLSRLVHHLTGVPPAGLRFAKGAVAIVEVAHGLAAGAGRLTAFLPPSALRGIRRGAK